MLPEIFLEAFQFEAIHNSENISIFYGQLLCQIMDDFSDDFPDVLFDDFSSDDFCRDDVCGMFAGYALCL